MAKFNLQYVFDGVLDPEIVSLDGSIGVYHEMDLVFAKPKFSHHMYEWAENAEVGDQFDDDDFLLVRVA